MAHPYKLYYWPLPFRGQLIRHVLVYLNLGWEEVTFDDIVALKALPIEARPAGVMAPPILYDREDDLYLSQMTAILFYLGDKHGLVPESAAKRGLTLKLLGDANDVLDEITRFGGRQMWDDAAWIEFMSQRFPQWLQIFERSAKEHGVTSDSGTMLGTETIGLVDLVTSALWSTMMASMPQLEPKIRADAPLVAALSDRVSMHPAIAAFDSEQRKRFGDLYCGGQIEASIREMIATIGTCDGNAID